MPLYDYDTTPTTQQTGSWSLSQTDTISLFLSFADENKLFIMTCMISNANIRIANVLQCP